MAAETRHGQAPGLDGPPVVRQVLGEGLGLDGAHHGRGDVGDGVARQEVGAQLLFHGLAQEAVEGDLGFWREKSVLGIEKKLFVDGNRDG